MALWKAHGRFSIMGIMNFSVIYYGSGVMSRNVYSSAVSRGRGRLLCTEILPELGRPPSTILSVIKLEALGSMVKTASRCVPRFDTIPECDGRTDLP